MRALVMHDIAAPPRVEEVASPRPRAGSVLVEVRASGLCRSDWHAWAGHDDVTLPHVPGHEFSGVVVEVGADVRRWEVGRRVTMPFIEGCGRCTWCRSGNAQVCPQQQQPGFTHWGSFAEHVECREADTNLVAVPDGVSFEAAASLGCRFATAYRALTGRAHARAGEWVVVIGAGGVGLSTVMIAVSLGCRVIAVDRNAAALDLARRHGAEATVLDDGSLDVLATLHELTAGGAHVSVDAVGTESTCATSILGLARRGRHVQIGLLPPVDGHPRLPMDRVIAWELDLLGSHGMAANDYPGLLEQVRVGTLRPHDLVSRTISLDEAAERLPTFDTSPLAGVTMIDPRR